MARFQPGQTIVTDVAKLEVDGDLPPGQYRFQLVIINGQGKQSLPDIRIVTVLSL